MRESVTSEMVRRVWPRLRCEMCLRPPSVRVVSLLPLALTDLTRGTLQLMSGFRSTVKLQLKLQKQEFFGLSKYHNVLS